MFRKTDVLFIEPTGALAARIERFRSYLVAALEIKADSSIVPGQPIALQWRLNTWPAAADGTVNVRIFIDGHLIREHADVSASESLNGTGWIDEHLISIADPAIAATIYRFGHRVILVEARDSAGSLYRARAGIDIVRDSFHLEPSLRQSWWLWKEATQRTELWKQPFDFTADFINRSKFSRMSSVSVDIREVLDEPTFDPCDAEPLHNRTLTMNDILAGATITFRFPYMYEWEWLTSYLGGWIISAAVSRTYEYGFSVRAIDQFGNEYHGCAPRVRIYANLPNDKANAGLSAVALSVTAAGLLVAAISASGTFFGIPAGLVLFGLAAATYASAQEAADIAHDPPEPDPDFRRPIEIELPRIHIREEAGPSLDALVRMIENVRAIWALERGRTVARARLMGANDAGDLSAARGIQQRYLELVRQMRSNVDEMSQLVTKAREQIELHPLVNPACAGSEAHLARSEAIPRELSELLRKSPEHADLAELMTSLRPGTPMLEFLRKNGLPVAQLATGVRKFVEAVEAATEGTLAGEKYRPPLPEHLRRKDPAGNRDVSSQCRCE